MDTLQNMRIFKQVVEYASFTTAAKHLDMATAQVSRAVSELEVRLRTRLLHRTTRRIALTEAGERYLARCNKILMYVDEAEAEASDAHMTASGKLRLHSLTSFGLRYLVPIIARYHDGHPSVEVDLTLSQHLPDLIEEGYDITITLSADLPDSALVSQRLGSVHSILCASPEYLRRNGTPVELSHLAQHKCLYVLAPTGQTDRWTFSGPDGEEMFDLGPAPLRVNIPEALSIAVKEGMGIGLVPALTAIPLLKSGALRRVLPDYTAQHLTIYALYPSRQYLDAKVRTWVDFVRQELTPELDSDFDLLRTLGPDL